MPHLAIVGAGECGARAAFALREKGFDGEITLVGEEPVRPYERPPLSKDALRQGLAPKHVAGNYEDLGIDLLTGVAAVELDHRAGALALSNGRKLQFDKALIATGSSARQLPGCDPEARSICTLRTHADAMAIRQFIRSGSHVAIIGAGFIGLELAATARQMGARVTVLEGMPRILMRGVPEAIAAILAQRHIAEGVDLRCSLRITAIEEAAQGVTISIFDQPKLRADLVVVGIGAVPNVSLAERVGLRIENGIAVDERLLTSAPNVFAAGDCCSFPLSIYGGRRVRLESWRNAQEQGSLAARNMLGADEAHSAVPWFWSDQYDLSLQIAGLSDEGTQTVRRDFDDGAVILFHLAGDGRLVAASGIGPGNAVARDIRLAEMLIAKGARPGPEALASPAVKLKSLLAA